LSGHTRRDIGTRAQAGSRLRIVSGWLPRAQVLFQRIAVGCEFPNYTKPAAEGVYGDSLPFQQRPNHTK